MSTIDFKLFPPPDYLARDIEGIRVASYGGGKPLAIKTCPNGLPGLVFHVSGTEPAIESLGTRSAQLHDVPPLFLHGQGTEPSIMKFKPAAFTTIQVIMKPYALYTVFGLDASSLFLGMLLPSDFGGEQLERQLRDAATTTERITLMERFLEDKQAQAPGRDVAIEKAVAFIEDHVATATVKGLLDFLDMPERQLQKRFAKVVGGSPQQFIRVKRVNEALRLMGTGQYDRLSDVAYALNYYDQSHFIRDVKALSWVTPKSITQKVSEFNHDLGGASYL
jgi:AraC-like DNA-binding protein